MQRAELGVPSISALLTRWVSVASIRVLYARTVFESFTNGASRQRQAPRPTTSRAVDERRL